VFSDTFTARQVMHSSLLSKKYEHQTNVRVKNGGNGGQRLVDRPHSVTHGRAGNEEKVGKQGEPQKV